MLKNFRSMPRFFRLAQKDEPFFLFWLVFSALMKGAAPLVNVILPKFILDELVGGKDITRMTLLITALALGNLIFSVMIAMSSKNLAVIFSKLFNHTYGHLAEKTIRLDMAEAEKKSSLDKIERAKYTLMSTGSMDETLANLGGALISLISVTILIIAYDWRLLPIALIFNLCTIPCFKKVSALELDNSQRGVPENRAFGYFCNIAGDFRFAKDMRLYNGSGFLLGKATQTMDRILKINHEFFTKSGFFNGLAAMAIQIQLAIIFLILGISLAVQRISVGTFSLLAGACKQFGEAINSIIFGMTNLMTISLELDPYFEYLDLDDSEQFGNGQDIIDPSAGEFDEAFRQSLCRNMVFQFDNVSFYYPSCDTPALNNLSFSFGSGEKLAIVGLNGAGKTTVVKLLCRLYTPQHGRILLNGVDIRTIPKEEYYKILSVVFQDFKFMPLSIAENIGCRCIKDMNTRDMEQLGSILADVGVSDWVDSLPRGVNTELTKLFAEDGAMPSGGQEQKLAIARSLKHDAPLLVLDEPTAALDPRSEEAVYEHFNSMTQGKTAIFISHRLSSTRMAERILVMDKGRIVEEGNHKKLMQDGGLYADMYTKQASHYMDEGSQARLV